VPRRPLTGRGAPPQAYEQYSGADLGAAARAGLARVAGLLLVVFAPARAEDAFWALVALVEDRLPASCVLKARAWSPDPSPGLHAACAAGRRGAERRRAAAWPACARAACASLIRLAGCGAPACHGEKYLVLGRGFEQGALSGAGCTLL
jgi:hypothetical protein